jgi:hypothetical protein
MSGPVPFPVEKVILSPVVSINPNSKESQLMSKMAELEAQSQVDSKFDTVLERFENNNKPLLTFAVAVLAYIGVCFLSRRK